MSGVDARPLVWVASRPPVPPFSGVVAVTLCGLTALSARADVELITYAEPGQVELVEEGLRAHWGRRVRARVLPYARAVGTAAAAAAGRFKFGYRLDMPRLVATIDALPDRDRLLVFDDIVFAPMLAAYGPRAILSPHDCMSEMFRSHRATSGWGVGAAEKHVQYLIARRYEERYYHRALLVHLITQRDRVLMQGINPHARYHVASNEDALNPGLSADDPPRCDVLVWADLSVPSSSRGAREFLRSVASDPRWPRGATVVLVGRVPAERVAHYLGAPLPEGVAYSPRLEDTDGRLRHGRVFVVPDAGGAGLKNRCVNVVARGRCLACTYEQMEGIEQLSDVAAINASTPAGLAAGVRRALLSGSYARVGEAAARIYGVEYSRHRIRAQWSEMLERAAAIRDGAAA